MNIFIPELAALEQRREKTRALKQAMTQELQGPTARPGENKKPLDIGFTGQKTRNTRHEAEFCPAAP